MNRPTLTAEGERRYDRAYRILSAAQKRAEKHSAVHWRLEEVCIVIGYAEPGYGTVGEDGDNIVAFGNWNPCNERQPDGSYISGFDLPNDHIGRLPGRVFDLLERAGVECEWSDEWSECAECGRAVRTQPDSYGWTPSFSATDDGPVCEDCTIEDATAYLEGLEGNPRSAVTLDIDPEDHGYFRIPLDFERGYHPGQADNPEMIGAALEAIDITRYIFRLDSVGQFDSRFSVYVHEDDAEDQNGADIRLALIEHGTADKVSPAACLSAALRNLPPAPEGPGTTVYKVTPEGTTVRKVTSEDFIEGRALD